MRSSYYDGGPLDTGSYAVDGPSPASRLRLEETLRYDAETGSVQTLMDGVVRHAIEVRRGLEDALVLEAVVLELRRRGYEVTRPDDDAAVCVTHLRHVPCRRGPEGCHVSRSVDAVRAVRSYHEGRADQ